MGKFYTEQQIQEAIAALERNSPGIWDELRSLARGASLPEQEDRDGRIAAMTRVCDYTYPKLSFIEQADDKPRAIALLSLDVARAVSASIASTRAD